MMVKIIMNSGVHYEIELNENQMEDLLYSKIELPGNVQSKRIRCEFIKLPCEKTIVINPTHISSMEIE